MQVTFGPFAFDHATRELRCGHQSVHLSPKAFELLSLLIAARPAALSKAELQQRLWPDTFVSDGSLAVLVAEIRRALGESDHRASSIRTISRFGYAFVDIPTTSRAPAAPARVSPTLSCALSWNGEHAWLHSGEYVLGRDPAADIHIDAVGVSRRHAAIQVTERVATLRDLASKNGTYADGERVSAPVPLGDDVEIQLGAVRVRFRRLRGATTTQTVAGAPPRRGRT
jgi:DNA-binding winged helix-turn-helix (wHTH) protein